jgi:hypothetical protein
MGQKIITFLGADCTDTILYISRVAYNLGLKVLIADESEARVIEQSLPYETGKEQHYRGVDIIKADADFSNSLSDYDLVLIYQGFAVKYTNLEYSADKIIVVTTFDRREINKTAELMKVLNKDVSIVKVYKDVIKGKIRPKFIDKYLEIDEFKIEKEYILPFSFRDMSCKILCQYDDVFKFQNISYEHKQFIKDIFIETLGIEAKTLQKAFAKAEGGR